MPDENKRTVLRSNRPKSSPSPTHETIFGAIKKSGKEIKIYMINGNSYHGDVSQFDKFTVTIRESESNGLRTIFKHAIESFGAM